MRRERRFFNEGEWGSSTIIVTYVSEHYFSKRRISGKIGRDDKKQQTIRTLYAPVP